MVKKKLTIVKSHINSGLTNKTIENNIDLKDEKVDVDEDVDEDIDLEYSDTESDIEESTNYLFNMEDGSLELNEQEKYIEKEKEIEIEEIKIPIISKKNGLLKELTKENYNY